MRKQSAYISTSTVPLHTYKCIEYRDVFKDHDPSIKNYEKHAKNMTSTVKRKSYQTFYRPVFCIKSRMIFPKKSLSVYLYFVCVCVHAYPVLKKCYWRGCVIAWWWLWNFMMNQLKFNRHPSFKWIQSFG